MKRLVVLIAVFVLVALVGESARGQDEQYLQVYSLIQEGDTLRSSGQPSSALARYLAAQTALQAFQRLNPDWNSKVVNYRLNYLADRVSEMSAKAASVPTAPKPAATEKSSTAAGAGELETQVNSLQGQVRQLETDKMVLEAKLRESLTAQPAVVDPREYAKAEQQIRSLQKENDLLKVNLSHQSKVSPADPRALEQIKQQLADANRQLTEQTEKAASLSAQKDSLQVRLDSLIPSDWNQKNIDRTTKELEEANRKLTEQSELASRLSLERTALQMRIKTLMTEGEAAAALRSENEILKKRVAELAAASPDVPQDASHQLSEALAQIAVLQSEKEMLRQENQRLERLASGRSDKQVIPVPLVVGAGSAGDKARVKQLERERDELQKKLAAAQKELRSRKGHDNGGQVEELTGQLTVLRTRLAVLEAQKVPYSEEELALFRRPDVRMADSKMTKKSSRELPPGSMTLVAEAEKDFASKRYDQAEEKYLQVLKKDESNVYTLGNLAAIQMEMNHLDEADKNLSQALAAAPDDSYSLSMMGYLRFRQQRYDDAIDVLGRAAKLDSRNPEIQNYLGLALSQKGMRGPAETALRKAIELDSNYASAHYNLAVVYATQKPPALALARWHYDKARSQGLPANAEMERMLAPNQTAASGQSSE